jgi:hypothetical protein
MSDDLGAAALGDRRRRVLRRELREVERLVDIVHVLAPCVDVFSPETRSNLT